MPLRVDRQIKRGLPPSCVHRCSFRGGSNIATPHLKCPQDKHKEALTLLERALAIRTHALGKSHEDTIISQNMVEMLGNQVRGQQGF